MANENAVKNGASGVMDVQADSKPKLVKTTLEFLDSERAIVVPKDTDILRYFSVSAAKDQEALIVNDATIHLLDQAFTMQDNFENASKFNRAFVLDAVRAHVKAECSRILASWDAAIAKTGKLHPTKTRVECEALLLEGRKARELKAMVDVAASLKRELS